jgi:hypothetical protein
MLPKSRHTATNLTPGRQCPSTLLSLLGKPYFDIHSMRLFEQLTDALSSDKDDEQSWRWSIKTVASTSLEGGPNEEGTDFSRAAEVHQITAEALSRLPKMHNTFHADTNSPTDQAFHERQIERLEEDNHPNAEHAAAITLSVQRWCDIIAQDHIQVDAQADMLLGLQMHMTANPAPGTPADLRADLEPNHQPDPRIPPGVELDDEASDEPFYANLQDAYATAYQLRVPGTDRLGFVVADTMRREAAMDNAIFRPNRLWSRSAMLIENRRAGDCVGAVAVQRPVRKRRREEKDTV